MKKLWNWFDENWYIVLGSVFPFAAFFVDCFGKGNKDHAIAWALLIVVYLLLIKDTADRKRAKAITDRLDILARVLLPEFCKGNCAISSYKKLMEEDGITFEDDDWYPCYFKPVGGQAKAHEVLDGLYNPSKKLFKLDPKFKKNIKEDLVWLKDNVLEYTMKETKYNEIQNKD